MTATDLVAELENDLLDLKTMLDVAEVIVGASFTIKASRSDCYLVHASRS